MSRIAACTLARLWAKPGFVHGCDSLFLCRVLRSKPGKLPMSKAGWKFYPGADRHPASRMFRRSVHHDGEDQKQTYFRIQSAVLDHDQARFIHRWGEKESLFRRQHMQYITCADRRSSVRDNPSSRKWLLVLVVQEHHYSTRGRSADNEPNFY
jgi:hypothetical protein